MYNVLILCTGNSARSILAEALLNRLGDGRVRAFSAGSTPKGAINPGAVRLLKRKGYDPAPYRSKSWDEFAGADAPVMNLILTVCDNAAGEVCPVWPGHPASGHWGQPDPADAGDTEAENDAAFEAAYAILERRIGALLRLPFETMPSSDLKRALAEIGALP